MDVKNAFVETAMGVFEAEYVNVVMGVNGAISGNLIMTAKKESALAIASAMLGGMEFTEVDDMVKSAIGELLNIIAGNAFSKVDVKAAVYISTPTFYRGGNFCFASKPWHKQIGF